MADIKKVIEISIDVIGNIGAKLQDASNSFLAVAQSLDTLSSSAKAVDSSVSTIVGSINTLGAAFDKIKPPSESFDKMYTELEKLSKLKVPNLKNIVNAMNQMQGMSIPDLGNMATELKKLDGIKAPQLDQFAKGLERLEKIKVSTLNTKLTALAGSLNNFKDIKVPQLDQLAKGLEKLQGINISTMNAKITALAGSLNNLSDIKSPQLNQFAKGLKKLEDINISQMNTKLTALSGSLNNFKDIKAPQLDQFAKGLQKLEDINISQMNTKISSLATSLINLSDIKAPNLDQFAKGLKQLNEFNLDEDLKQLDPILSNVAKALRHLEDIKVPNLKGLGTAIKELNELDKLKINKDLPAILSGIATALDQFKDTKVPGINNFVNGLKKLVDLDVQKIKNKIEELNKAILKLDKAGQLSSFNKFATNLGRVDKALQGVNVNVRRSNSSLARFGYAIGSASSGLSVLASKLYGVSRGLSAINAGLATMTGFTAIFAGLYAVKGATSLLIEFDDSIRAAGATAQASSDELSLFEDAARQMGATTRYTATEAADALKQLSQAGFTVNESTQALPKVLQLAQAGFLDIGEAADITTNVMKGYGMQVSDLGRVNDVLVAAFTNANTNLSQLGVAFAYVGPLARSAGIEFEETAALLAALAQSGYKSTKAGMILRNGIVNLLNPTARAADAMADMGIKVRDSEGNMLSMINIIDQFRQASANTSDIINVFGKRAGPGFASLISQGDNALKEFLNTMMESNGIAREISEQMESGIGGAIRELKSSWQELALEFGRDIEVKLVEYLRGLTEVLRKNKTQIANLASDLAMFVAGLINIGASFLGFIARFKGLTIVVVSLTASMIALAGAASLVGKTMMSMKAAETTLVGLAAINFAPTIAGLAAMNTGLVVIGSTVKALGVAMIASPLATMSKVILYPVMIGVIALNAALKGLVVGIGLVTGAVRTLTVAMMSNPLGAIIGIVAAIAAAIAAYTIFKQSIADSADEHLRNAESIKAELDALNSQISVAEKLKEVFDNAEEGTSEWLDAEKELAQILPDVNTELTEHGNLIAKVGDGYNDNKDKLNDYIDSLNVKKKLSLTMQIEETAAALDKSSKGYEKQLAYMKRYYATGEENARISQKIIKWVTALSGTYGKNRTKLLDLQKAESKSRKALDKLGRSAVLGGTSFDELSSSLDKMNISAEVKQNVLNSWKKWNDYKKRGIDISNSDNSDEINKQIQDQIANDNIQIAKDSLDQRKADLKQHLYDISVLEATGVITHEESESQKLETSLDHYGAIYAEAKANYKRLLSLEGSVSEKEKEAAQKTELKAKEDYYAAKLSALVKYGKDYESEKKSLNKNIQKLDEEEIKNVDKVSQAKEKARESQIEADRSYAAKKEEIETALAKKVEDINEKLKEKLEGFIKDRAQAEKDAENEIKGIDSSLGDKLLKIRQRDMNDVEKDTSNKISANKKYAEGLRQLSEAKKNDDKDALERGKALIEQAGTLYESLDSSSDASSGVIKVASALKKVSDIELALNKKLIDEKEKKANEAAEKEKKEALNISQVKLKATEDEYKLKIDKIELVLKRSLDAEGKRHNKVMSNLKKEINSFKSMMDNSKSMMDQVQSDTPDENIDYTANENIDYTANENTFDYDNYDSHRNTNDELQKLGKEAEKAKPPIDRLAASLQLVRKEGETDINLRLRADNTKQVDELIKGFKNKAKNLTESDPLEVKTELETSDVVGKIKELSKEYQSVYEKYNDNGVVTLPFTLDDQDKTEVILKGISDELDILGTSESSQNLQDKVNLLNAMEDSGIDTTEAFKVLNTEISNISGMELSFDYIKGFELIDESGKKIKGLREEIQSNPFKIAAEIDVSDEDTLKVLPKINGLIKSIGESIHKINLQIEIDDQVVKDAQDKVNDSVSDTPIEVPITTPIINSPAVPFDEGINNIISKLTEIDAVEIIVPINIDSTKMDELVLTIQSWNSDVKININTIDVNNELYRINNILNSMVNKFITLSVNVENLDQWQIALDLYDKLIDKVVTITTKYVTSNDSGSNNESTDTNNVVQAFETGGMVFKKLTSPLISIGSSLKDDVPAILSKNEFVQPSQSVKKYGINFMERLRRGLVPTNVIQLFSGGLTSGNINESLINTVSSSVGIPTASNSVVNNWSVNIDGKTFKPTDNVSSLSKKLMEEVRKVY